MNKSNINHKTIQLSSQLFTLKSLIMILLTIGIINTNHAQFLKSDTNSVYRVHKAIEIPATIGLFASHYLWGFDWVQNKPSYNVWEIEQLDANDIWAFDRVAIKQDASYRNTADKISDYGLNIMLAAPALLALDSRIRKDWADLLVLYGETHAINTSLYVMSTGLVDRTRPLMYNDGVPLDEKLGSNVQNSFFSGHVSSTASSSFFMAKVYTDYHPELGNKKYWFYAAALLPPAFVGFYRVKALKHFPTDVITGTLVGAATGILVPHLHKRKKKSYGFTFAPFVGEVNGIYIKYAFK